MTYQEQQPEIVMLSLSQLHSLQRQQTKLTKLIAFLIGLFAALM